MMVRVNSEESCRYALNTSNALNAGGALDAAKALLHGGLDMAAASAAFPHYPSKQAQAKQAQMK